MFMVSGDNNQRIGIVCQCIRHRNRIGKGLLVAHHARKVAAVVRMINTSCFDLQEESSIIALQHLDGCGGHFGQ